MLSFNFKNILNKAVKGKELNREEIVYLLKTEDEQKILSLFSAADYIRKKYVGNEIHINCLYCGFRKENKELKRKTLTEEEVKEEVKSLEEMGHKRLLLVWGENRNLKLKDMVRIIQTVYDTKKGEGEIRRVNVNLAPLNTPDFKTLKRAGIGTYQLFQETYHQKSYYNFHPSGPKADYEWRLMAMDRAMEAGIDDVGIGVLFGLYDYKFEVLSLLSHAIHLDEKFGVGPHTISVPRIEPALNAPLANNPPSPVSDKEFKRLVAILRLAVPYTGIILSTRETPQMREELFALGVSQISAASRTNPGGYKEARSHSSDSKQFTLGDTRTLDEVIRGVCKLGYIPSFCTACYRKGRTGEDFMSLAKPGNIQDFCLPNAILTFKEYLLDYAEPLTREISEKTLYQQIKEIKNKKIRDVTLKRIKWPSPPFSSFGLLFPLQVSFHNLRTRDYQFSCLTNSNFLFTRF